MLNEERVRLMTKLAAYEKRKGRRNIKISRYFRGDYLILQLLKTVLCTTVSYGIAVGLYVLYHFETLTENLYEMDLPGFLQQIIKWYVVLLIVSGIITYVVYSYRYVRARKSLKGFMSRLKQLSEDRR